MKNDFMQNVNDMLEDTLGLVQDIVAGKRHELRAYLGFSVIVLGCAVMMLITIPLIGAGLFIAGKKGQEK